MASVKCPKCGRIINNVTSSAVKCSGCGNIIRIASTETNTQSKETPKTKAEPKPKTSALSIIALICSILGCTSIIGLILAIIDLCKDGRKKGCSVAALCIGIFWLIAVIASGVSGTEDNKQASNNINNTYSATQSNQESAYDELPNRNLNTETTNSSDNTPISPEKSEMALTKSEKNINNTEFDYDGMHVKYVKHEILTNMAGEKCLAVYYEFTNNSDENKEFIYSFSDKVFQNGVELEASIFHVNEESKNSGKEIQPGTTITVTSGFVLGESRDSVTLQIEPWISFSDEKLMEISLSLQ